MNQHFTNDPDALLRIIQQIKETYQNPPQQERKRGKAPEYSALSFLLLAVVAVIMRTYKDSELHKLLSKDQRLRLALGFERVPHRTTIGRRLNGQVLEAEEQINSLGSQIVDEVKPTDRQSSISAIDGRMYEAVGPAWHKSSREAGIVPPSLRNVDVESNWSKSGYRGWVQGYRLVVQSLVWPQPVPIFACWAANQLNEANLAAVSLMLEDLKVTAVLLGDTTFASQFFTQRYQEVGGWVLTPAQLPKHYRTWKHDIYDFRKQTIELLFQRIIQAVGLKDCQVKGLGRNGAFVLASVWLYQVLFLTNYRNDLPASIIKDQIDEARWRIAS